MSTPRPRPIGLIGATLALLRKDLLIEWRTRARLNAIVFFALATLLMFSFALGPDTRLLEKNAGGYFWLAILFASVLAMGESFRVESENACLDGIRLAPADARAIYLSKALGNALLLIALGIVLLPVMVALYGVKVVTGFVDLGTVLLLGSLALSAPGTVYAAISSNARARDVLLPLLLFPLVIPALLSLAKATSLVLQGDPMNQLGSWLGLLLGFNLIYWGVGFVLFPRIIED
ncbi:heme exporter protein CcmB [Myxococcus sp. CA051A]|uniref:Heme exporter protein B n=1 Tax=Myxococcus llanfairpwllgwyngyllgogerychwyrndrobwllllantysiliogogogochensis TaxID=2590453 RepID=A0A540X186_9BACT|nr:MULTISPECIES: heme exporter protein CcmB [Myxococcus]NTX07923.1 heme exporter protein CcmB [Myxococcus sp. CA040A]NTX66680.1 heme exporter protein CcmB [Myxococcus sp. CA051A]TQF15031.1 transcriptional regulator [Myxococcus llanfairpwllgwyngyllgogerychwyrndrobwllllantysiliogogogochensis]